MPDRRQNAADAREKLDKQLQEAGNEEGATGSGSNDAPSGADRPGTFAAIDDTTQEEVNRLFRLLHDEEYMTIGTYDIQSDGESTLVNLTVNLPSSTALPRNPSPDEVD